MRKIRKFQLAGKLGSPGLFSLSTNYQLPLFNLSPPQIPYLYFTATNTKIPEFKLSNDSSITTTNTINKTGNSLTTAGINALGGVATDMLSDKIFGDSEAGRVAGSIFSSGVGSATNTIANNLLKSAPIAEGLAQNMGSSLAGAGIGIGANYLGLSISSAFGNSAVGKALGAGVSSAVGNIGGKLAGSMLGIGSKAATTAGKAAATAEKASKIGSIIGKGAGSMNLIGLGATVLGSALGAGFGDSKEYGGKYGNITQFSDMAYDGITVAANAIPVAGQLVSGLLALNKGISNIFGSTSGMTKLDALIGSPLLGLLTGIGAPLKWINMIKAKTTGTFDNQSWLNTEKANSFMGSAFGDLQDKFDKAKEEAGKTYGTFSLRAYRKALRNLNFANLAWDEVLDMADLNELQNIRSQLMSSINNQKYAQDIQGGWTPLARGKFGMKIFNNATNHFIGMRLLSGAALVDSKQMILCSAVD